MIVCKCMVCKLEFNTHTHTYTHTILAMAPSTPSSGAGATFTAIDLARWTLPQCRAKCWALGLPEYGLLS